MKKIAFEYKVLIIVILWAITCIMSFQVGEYHKDFMDYFNKAQIVKEALSNVPQDLSDPKVAKEFKAMIRKFKGGKR
jgi:hypothetical protein